MSDLKNLVWVEKYRPKTIADTILPQELKEKFQRYVDEGDVPNLLLVGPPGIGKTTVARAMLEQLGADYIVINGSMSGNIDTLRYDISKFASSVSFTGGRKYVILDEADYLNARSTQPALRNFMEEFSSNCGFILTANYKDKILEPLRSRCSVVDFKIHKEDAPKVATQFFKRAKHILDQEGKEYDQKSLVEVIQHYYPDWRRVINEISSANAVDETFVHSLKFDGDFTSLLQNMSKGDYKSTREWVENNSDLNTGDFYGKLYKDIPPMVSSDSDVADAIIILAQYQYQEAFAANPIVNRAAAMFELIGGVKWN